MRGGLVLLPLLLSLITLVGSAPSALTSSLPAFDSSLSVQLDRRRLDGVWAGTLAALNHPRVRGANPRTIWFTGHGLGGAMASLALLRLADAQPATLADCAGLVLFGSPRCLDAPAASALGSLRVPLYRFMLGKDLVARLPLRSFDGEEDTLGLLGYVPAPEECFYLEPQGRCHTPQEGPSPASVDDDTQRAAMWRGIAQAVAAGDPQALAGGFLEEHAVGRYCARLAAAADERSRPGPSWRAFWASLREEGGPAAMAEQPAEGGCCCAVM